MALAAFGDSKIMNGQVTLWQVVAAYVIALAGGSISTSLHLAHKPFCALISFAAGTLLGVTLFAILPESLLIARGGRWHWRLRPATRFFSSSARMFITFVPLARPVILTLTRQNILARSLRR